MNRVIRDSRIAFGNVKHAREIEFYRRTPKTTCIHRMTEKSELKRDFRSGESRGFGIFIHHRQS